MRQLLIDKIAKFELGSSFSVFETEISRAERLAHRIFKGTQSHNSENIKSLEGDDIAWVEEETSLRLLRPLAPKPRPNCGGVCSCRARRSNAQGEESGSEKVSLPPRKRHANLPHFTYLRGPHRMLEMMDGGRNSGASPPRQFPAFSN